MSQRDPVTGRFTHGDADYVRDAVLNRPVKHLGLIEALAPRRPQPRPPIAPIQPHPRPGLR
jgi:hypothetical protein